MDFHSAKNGLMFQSGKLDFHLFKSVKNDTGVYPGYFIIRFSWIKKAFVLLIRNQLELFTSNSPLAGWALTFFCSQKSKQKVRPLCSLILKMRFRFAMPAKLAVAFPVPTITHRSSLYLLGFSDCSHSTSHGRFTQNHFLRLILQGGNLLLSFLFFIV
jgi:hypothetical protein